MVKLYISFPGNCSEALDFYQQVFQCKVQNLATYGDFGEDNSSGSIIHSELEIEGTTFIFSDYNEAMTIGDNFSIMLEVADESIVHTYYQKLKDRANITIPLAPLELPDQSFRLYANLMDKFGINWVILCK